MLCMKIIKNCSNFLVKEFVCLKIEFNPFSFITVTSTETGVWIEEVWLFFLQPRITY
jgi:hypothetical protein